MHLLSTAGLIKIRRLSSTNLYTINPILLVNEVNLVQGVGNMVHISSVPNAHINKTSLNNIYNNIGKNKLDKIDRIVNSKNIDKQTKIIELASVPLPELKQCINKHPYYVQKAIEYQEQELRDKRSLPKHIVEQAMTAAVSKTIKNRSASYKAKVEYNKRNNLDWQGKPKK